MQLFGSPITGVATAGVVNTIVVHEEGAGERPEAASVLLVQDDQVLRGEICSALKHSGCYVRAVARSDAALALSTDGWWPDITVVDLLLPMRDTYASCQALRAAFGTPIILAVWDDYTGQSRVEADAILARPVTGAGLLVLVRELLKRGPLGHRTFSLGSLTLLPRVNRAYLGAREILLSRDETALLARLLTTPGRPVKRAELLATLRGIHQDVDPRHVDVHMVRIMVKIAERDEVRVLRTDGGDGYKVVALEKHSPAIRGAAGLARLS